MVIVWLSVGLSRKFGVMRKRWYDQLHTECGDSFPYALYLLQGDWGSPQKLFYQHVGNFPGEMMTTANLASRERCDKIENSKSVNLLVNVRTLATLARLKTVVKRSR